MSHTGNYYCLKNVCKRSAKVFFSQYRDPVEDGEGEAEERVNEQELSTRRTKASEQSTSPIVRRVKTRTQQAERRKKVPPKGRKKK